jgi:hypothetical protein
MTVVTKGFSLCLLDDLTVQYEEPLVTVALSDLTLKKYSLSALSLLKDGTRADQPLNIVEK